MLKKGRAMKIKHDTQNCPKCAEIRGYSHARKATAGDWARMTDFIKTHTREIKAEQRAKAVAS